MFDTLVLSGGHIKGICHLGALDYLYDNQLLKHIKQYVGTSIGSIISYLLIIGYTPLEIMLEFCKSKYLDKMKIDIFNFIQRKGAFSFSPIHEFLEHLTIKKIGILLTMKKLKDLFDKSLTCVTYNYTLHHIEYLNVETNPDMPCLTALRMSCNLPGIFEDYFYNNHYYIDGGVYESFPISYVDVNTHKVIAISLNSDYSNNIMETDDDSILVYFYKILNIPRQQVIKNTLTKVDVKKSLIIDISIEEINLLTFKPSLEDSYVLYNKGYEVAKLAWSEF